MNFSTPQKVLDTIEAGDIVERIRGDNRVQIQNQANGRPPLSGEEARKYNLKINVNWNEFAQLLAQARRQYLNALMGGSRFFTVRMPDAPQEYREQWGMWITQWINRKLKRSKKLFFVLDNMIKALVAHGIGPRIWYDKETVIPSFVAIEDLRVATDTTTDLENLMWFSVRKAYTAGELSEKVWGEHCDCRWNREAVAQILQQYWDTNFDTTPYDWLTAPEKMAELIKQNLGYYSSDAVPVMQFWHFYYLDYDCAKPVWRMYVIPERNTVKGVHADVFLYDGSDEVVRNNLSQILAVQYADMSFKSPAMHQSVRSLGFMLMEPCFWMNMARCRTLQHTFESFNWLLRSDDPSGRARAQKVEFFDRAIIPQGITFEPNGNRPEPDKDMVEYSMAQLKQLMSEASASYTQNLDTGTQKEQTAFETRVKLSNVNSMMSAIINYCIFQEVYVYEEMCRRLCMEGSEDPLTREFRAYCKKKKIPMQYLDVEMWDIYPDIPLGGGNPVLEQAEAQQLFEVKESFAPSAQQIIKHKFVASFSNPDLADQIAPLDQVQQVTRGQERAEFLFGTLMQGVPAQLKEDVSPIEQFETLAGLLAGKVAQIEQQGNVATPSEIAGLNQVVQYCAQLLQSIAQNKAEKQRVKVYKDMLGKLVNAIRGFEQRGAAQQNGNTLDPQTQAKVAGKVIEAQANARIKEAAAQQKMQHKQQSFLQDQQRRNFSTIADNQRGDAKAIANMQQSRLQTFRNGNEEA